MNNNLMPGPIIPKVKIDHNSIQEEESPLKNAKPKFAINVSKAMKRYSSLLEPIQIDEPSPSIDANVQDKEEVKTPLNILDE